MKSVSQLSIFFVFAAFGMLASALNIQKNYYPDYKKYNMQVNHTGISFDENIQPQHGGRILKVGDYPQGEGKGYDVEVLGNSTVKCNKKYEIDQGKETKMTIYTGECFSTNNTRYLVTCRDEKDENSKPDHKLGWAVVNLNGTANEAFGYEGAQIRFDNSTSFTNRSNTTQPEKNGQIQVEVLCGSAGSKNSTSTTNDHEKNDNKDDDDDDNNN